jgi:hypothetical protein
MSVVEDEQVTSTASDSEEHELVCMDSSHGADGFRWTPATTPDKPRTGGRRAKPTGSDSPVSDIEEKLLSCIPQGTDFTPYGAVEDRFFELWPDDADTLLAKYGHMWRGDEQRSGTYTMSMYLAHRLSSIERQGLAEHIDGPSDERWAHLATFSYWRLPQEHERR